jgi:hypothetical protein
VPESQLSYDPQTRRLNLAGGSRKDSKAAAAEAPALEYIRANAGKSGRQITEAMLDTTDHRRDDIRAAIKRLVSSGEVYTTSGPRRSTLHSPSSERVGGSARAVSERTESECASALIERALHTHTDETSERPAHLLQAEACSVCGEPRIFVDPPNATTHPACEAP